MMFHASQESAQTARNQVTRLTEEVSSLQNQLTAANAALKAAVSSGGASTLHRIPAPTGSGGTARGIRNRLARKTAGDIDQALPSQPEAVSRLCSPFAYLVKSVEVKGAHQLLFSRRGAHTR